MEKRRGEAENKRGGRKKCVVVARIVVCSIVLVSEELHSRGSHVGAFSLTVTMSNDSNPHFRCPIVRTPLRVRPERNEDTGLGPFGYAIATVAHPPRSGVGSEWIMIHG